VAQDLVVEGGEIRIDGVYSSIDLHPIHWRIALLHPHNMGIWSYDPWSQTEEPTRWSGLCLSSRRNHSRTGILTTWRLTMASR